MERDFIVTVFIFVTLIIFLNLVKFLVDFLSNSSRYREVRDIRFQVDNIIRPRLASLERKFENDEESEEEDFGNYVFNLYRDRFEGKNMKIVEREICRCCDNYEEAECKEDYCLEGVCKL